MPREILDYILDFEYPVFNEQISLEDYNGNSIYIWRTCYTDEFGNKRTLFVWNKSINPKTEEV